MDKQAIRQAIVDRVLSAKAKDYSIWTIGLTHDPDERKGQHRKDGMSTEHWKQWTATSLSDARDIESYFINQKGMKGGTGGDLSPYRSVYVYMF